MALWPGPILAGSRGGRGNIDESDYGDVATAGKINAGYLACATDIVILQFDGANLLAYCSLFYMYFSFYWRNFYVEWEINIYILCKMG